VDDTTIKTVNDKHGLVTKENSLLLIIDAQEKLMPVISDRDKIMENMMRLARFSNITGLPVIATEQEKLGHTITELKQELGNKTFISKIHFNCFFCDAFVEEINKINKTNLILAGVEAHICVAQTAIFALPRFNVHIISDAVSSRTPENRIVALERMRQCGVTTSSTEMFIYEVLQKAGTDEFKAVLSIVK